MSRTAWKNWGWIIPLIVIVALLGFMYRSGEALKVPDAPHGGLSLQFAQNPGEALKVLNAWSQKKEPLNLIELAQSQIHWDFLLIFLYAFSFFRAIRAAESLFDSPMKDFVHTLAWAPVVAGALDFFPENLGMLWMLCSPNELPSILLFDLVACAASLKWLLLLITVGFLVSAAFIWIFHSKIRATSQVKSATPSEVLHTELDHIAWGRLRSIAPRGPFISPYDDQAAWQRAHDSNLFGLALSGGGIRSATFSLGVLQALARQRLLSRFDYLSTVSGGGYIGAWLSAWVVRVGGISKVEEELSRTGTPVAPIEFLRSYSNYLTPRTGVFGVDTWTAIATWMRNFSPNMLIVIASMWSVLALIMIVALTASRFELVLGTYAALCVFRGK